MNMPLQNLSVRAFRGATQLVDLAFENKPVVMIFGENGTGKSTIVDAIDFVCNEHAGSIDGKQSTPVKDYLPALGCKASDVQVDLKWSAKTFKATLSGSKAKVIGPMPRPKAKILRRAQILEIVDTQPAKRYEAFSRFVAVPNVEKAESTLREADRIARDDFNLAVRALSTASDELERLYKEAGSPKPDIRTWAKSKNDTEPKDLNARIAQIDSLLGLVKSESEGLEALNRAIQQASSDHQAVQSFTIELQAAEEASAEAKSDLLTLLDSAEQYLTTHDDAAQCPVCEHDINRTELLAHIAARKATGFQVAEANRKLDAATKKEERSNTLLENEGSRFLATSGRLAKGFHDSRITAVQNAGIEWSRFTSFLSDQSPSRTPESLTLAKELLTACNGVENPMRTERETASQEVEALRAIKLQYGAALKNRKQAKQLESLSQRLTALLSIVEKERKKFVDNALDSIRKRVDDLYSKLHPGENIGDIKLQLDPSRRGSLNVSSRFESEKDVPPQAYYSEAHLDTLGICIFIALAERDSSDDTLLVLDDVLTSTDESHIQRFIAMIHDEVKLPVLITTHYRPWRDKYRYAKGPVANVQLIELLSWSKMKGIRHTKTKLEVDALRELLAQEPIDRQGVASKAGVLLEAALREVCLLYRCKLPLDSEGRHTLGDYLTGIDSKLRAVMKCVSVNQASAGTPGSEVTTTLKQHFDAIAATTIVRNLVGAHFNPQGMNLSDGEVREFATATLALLDVLVCKCCGELPRKNQGSYFTCGCKAQQLHPLAVPGAMAAQIGN
jgi:energy-coupling factor transporter ATP-binding protein EcfA2